MQEATRSRSSSITFLAGFGFGAFVGVAMGLIAILIVDPGSNQDTGTTPIGFVQSPTATGTVLNDPENRPSARTALDVRLGPGPGFAVIGLLARGDGVEPVGRDDQAGWVAIRFPPGSTGRGWVPVTALDNVTNVNALAVVL